MATLKIIIISFLVYTFGPAAFLIALILSIGLLWLLIMGVLWLLAKFENRKKNNK